MAELITFLIIIAAGLFFAEFFKPVHMPYVVTLIIGGMVLGPHHLGMIRPDPTMEFIGSIGYVFLMFMAGIEVRLSSLSRMRDDIGLLSLLNASLPFLAGTGLLLHLGYGWDAAVLMGIVFISSSVAAVVPSLRSTGLMSKKLGKLVLGGILIEDVVSLIALSVFLQMLNPTSTIPLPVFYLLIFLFLIFLQAAIRELRRFYLSRIERRRKDLFEKELRFTFAVLIATVVIFDLIGLHPMIAGFFAGMTLSEALKREDVGRKLHALGYGIFIPVFFVLLGTKTDISALGRWEEAGLLTLSMIVVFYISKIASGYVAGRAMRFGRKQSLLIGVATTPQLSTTLAVAFIGLELGILGAELIVALTSLSIISTMAAPFMIDHLTKEIIPRDRPEERGNKASGA